MMIDLKRKACLSRASLDNVELTCVSDMIFVNLCKGRQTKVSRVGAVNIASLLICISGANTGLKLCKLKLFNNFWAPVP